MAVGIPSSNPIRRIANNVKDSIVDIGRGIKEVVTGKSKSQQETESANKQFNKLNQNPVPDKNTGYTSQNYSTPAKTSSSLRSTSGGGSSSRSNNNQNVGAMTTSEDVGNLSPSEAVEKVNRQTQASLRDKDLSKNLSERIKFEPTETSPVNRILKKANKYAEYVTTPQGVNQAFNYLGEKTLQAGEYLGGKVEKIAKNKGVDTNKSVFFKPLNVSRSAVTSTIGGLYEFSFFQPLMSTGTAATQVSDSEYTEVFDANGVGRFVKKKDLADALLRKFDKAYQSSGREGIYTELKKIAKSSKDIKGVENLLENLRNKGYIKSYVVDTTTGAFSVESLGSASAQPTILKFELNVPKIRTVEVAKTSTAVRAPSIWEGTGQYEKTQEYSAFKPSTKQKTGTLNNEGTQTRQKNILGMKVQTNTKQTPKTAQPQINILDTKTNQQVKQTPKTTQKTQQQTRQVQKNIQQTQQDFFKPRKLLKPTPQIKTKSFLFPKLSGSMREKIQRIKEGESFEAVGFRFGKEVSLGKGSKEKAASQLKGFLKGTLGASGYLKTSSGNKLTAEETGLLKDFIKSKRNEFLVVEERSKRLKRGGQEVREIAYFKKRSSGKNKKKSSGLFNF